ncbi:hypothetical protein AVEN_75673-1 [Araneus ventricosus]|uniref:Uncharacterized protein n=1 Tax=Araneus ventricosus TaxID=182803 RepID=A0A4Y2D6X8_ARAVE|nr:hypothetical protein AVEN_75673-1 [Araneus ventricosus]
MNNASSIFHFLPILVKSTPPGACAKAWRSVCDVHCYGMAVWTSGWKNRFHRISTFYEGLVPHAVRLNMIHEPRLNLIVVHVKMVKIFEEQMAISLKVITYT